MQQEYDPEVRIIADTQLYISKPLRTADAAKEDQCNRYGS